MFDPKTLEPEFVAFCRERGHDLPQLSASPPLLKSLLKLHREQKHLEAVNRQSFTVPPEE